MENRQGGSQAVPAHPSVDIEAGGEFGPAIGRALRVHVLEGRQGGDQAISSHQPVDIEAGGSVRSSAPPIGGRAIHVMKRLIDSLLIPEVVDGLAAGWQDVVVDYDEAAASDPMIERLQRVHRRSVHIAVKTQDGELLDWGLGQGVLEPTRQKGDLLVKQSEALEVVLHFIERYG